MIYRPPIFLLMWLAASALAQQNVFDQQSIVANPKPTWETQKQARTWQLYIPAPRGIITDRNGKPLTQSRLSYNLAINFPTPLDLTKDSDILAFARQQITLAKGLLGREIYTDEKAILEHYKNRGMLPLDIVEDLKPNELGVVSAGLTPTLIVRQTYARVYPEARLAAHIVGYVGREAPLSVRPVENKDYIFPETEGREGIEQIFNQELRGQPGVLHVTFDAEGRKTSERIAQPPVPGYNVILTIDSNLQAICEKVLSENCKRGALVMIDPQSGEILAMASWPTYDPNIFVPLLNRAAFDAVNKDPDVPLYPRAFRTAYPPGSTFKTVVGVAALQDGVIKPSSEFGCPTALSVGNFVFHNWKKTDAGSLNFVEAFTQSCNTWFYQVGLKTGSKKLIGWANRLGLGSRTGLPLKAEEAGVIPTDAYMLKKHKRKILNGDVANMSIGQGDILITPLQMAQMMSIIAAGGVFHQTRLVKQVQTLDNKVVAAYTDRVREDLHLKPEVLEALKKAMVGVTSDGQGTGHKAAVDGVKVAGKTGTAQWGKRTAAWFTGFAPADVPQYAFAALYEGEPDDDSIHGGSHAAPLIGKALKLIYKKKSKEENEEASSDKDEEAPSEADESD